MAAGSIVVLPEFADGWTNIGSGTTVGAGHESKETLGSIVPFLRTGRGPDERE